MLRQSILKVLTRKKNFFYNFGDRQVGTRLIVVIILQCFPGGSDGNESTCNAGDLGSIPGWGRSPKEGMETHFSILAWRIPWNEEPGGL